MTTGNGPSLDPDRAVENPVRHEFIPHNPAWFMPRCRVCREFEDHYLHRTQHPFCPDCGDTGVTDEPIGAFGTHEGVECWCVADEEDDHDLG